MTLRLHDGEPEAGPWRVEPLTDLVARLLPSTPPPPRWARVVAVDGRSASGKTTLALRIAGTSSDAVVVHTDDIAWYEAIMDWAHLLAGGILEPIHRGEAVSYRPPKWDERGRSGAIEVPASCDLVVVEGVGSGRAELAPLYDAVFWVQADARAARARGLERDAEHGRPDEVAAFWDHWEGEEAPHFAQDRPWTRAAAVLAGTPSLPHDPATDVVVAPRIAS